MKKTNLEALQMSKMMMKHQKNVENMKAKKNPLWSKSLNGNSS
jgi:hypothetical protein